MKYVVTLNNKKYEVEVEKGEAILLSTAEIAPPAPAAAPLPTAPVAPAAPIAPPPSASVSGTQVKSPMPGTIVTMRVQVGQKVQEGDAICILEAMKMENEITAPCGGTVAQVSVQKGAAVETGALLAVIS